MATRDVQFIIRARDEASRAFEGITNALEQLTQRNSSAGASSNLLSNDLGKLAQALGSVDQVARIVNGASERAGNSFEAQRAKVKGLEADLANLKAQSAAAGKSLAGIKAAGAATGNKDAEAAQIKLVAAAQADLEKQISRKVATLGRERAALESISREYQHAASLANAFDAVQPGASAAKEQLAAAEAVAKFSRDIATEVEREAAARAKVASALKEQAAAAQQEVAGNRAQTGINALLGVKDRPTTSAASSAAFFKEQLAAAEAVGVAARQIGAAEQQQIVWLDRIRNSMNPLVAIQQHYREEIEKANAAKAAGLFKTEAEYQAVMKLLRAEEKRAMAEAGVGPDGRPTMFGMKPWQATNLMYQVNDVASGLAMGQKPSQIIAQQLGQIVQLFPKLGAGIMSAFGNPYIVIAAATFGAIAYAVKQAADQSERLRAFSGLLKSMADGGKYSAEALNENVKALKEYHLTAEEAVAITREFVKDGLNPSYFESFGMAAKDMSRILGIDVKDAAQQVAQAFTAGYDAIAKLDDATGFLTAAEREHIRTLFESGRAADARTEAFDKFQKKQHEAAEEMRGPWTQSIEQFSSAWERLKDSLADSAFANNLKTELDGLAEKFQSLAELIEYLNSLSPSNPQGAGASPNSPTSGDDNAWLGDHFAQIREGRDRDTKAAAAADQKALEDARTEIKLQRDLQTATSDAAKAKIAGQQAYRDEINKTGNAAVAAAKRQAAEEQVLTQIQMQRRQGLIGSASQFLGRREGNREDAAVLQALFKQYGVQMPKNVPLDSAKAAWCAAFVNAILGSKGLPGTGSLSAASFKNYGTGVGIDQAQPGDIVVVKSSGTSSGSHVGFFQGFGPNGTVRILGGNQGKAGAVSVSNFSRGSVQAVRRAGNIAEGYDQPDSEAQYAMQQAAAQDGFNKSLQIEAATRALVVKSMRDQLGLSVDALYNAQKQEEIEKAVLARKQQATDKQLTFSPEQESALRKEIGDQYDAEHAMGLVNDRIREQTDLRSALMQAISDASARGDNATVERLTVQLNALTPAIEDAIAKAEAFWKALPDGPAKIAALESFRQLRDSINDTAAALQKLKVESADRAAGGASSLRDALTSQIDQQQLLGDKTGADNSLAQLGAVNDKLVELIQLQITAREGWLAMSDAQLLQAGLSREGIQAEIIGLRQSQNQAQMLGRQFLMTGRQINESLAGHAVNAIDSFFQRVAQGQNIVSAFWQSLVQGIADFLREIALAILKQTIFNALNKGGSNGGGGVGGAIASAIGSLFHGGGIAGSPSTFRDVHPGVFSGAVRYHTGGIAGLRPDEQAAILRKGEEVLTEDNPRHRKNAGRDAPGAPPRGLRQVLAIGDDEIANAMSGAAGDEVHFTWLKRNRATVRQELGL